MSEALTVTDRIGAEGAVAPRISLDDMTTQIAAVYYLDGRNFARYAVWTDFVDKAGAGPAALSVFTICMMVLKSGFIVIDKSAPVSPENFDAVKGRLFAYEGCIRQLWPLFAFALKQGRLSP